MESPVHAPPHMLTCLMWTIFTPTFACWRMIVCDQNTSSEREGRMQQFVILFQEVLRGRVGKGDLRGRRRMAWIFLLRL